MQAASQVHRRFGLAEQAEQAQIAEMPELPDPAPDDQLMTPAIPSDAFVKYQRSELALQAPSSNVTSTVAGPAETGTDLAQRASSHSEPNALVPGSRQRAEVPAINVTNSEAGLAETGTGFAQQSAARSEPNAPGQVPRNGAEEPISKLVDQPQTQLGPVLSKRPLPPGASAWVRLRKSCHASAAVILFAMRKSMDESMSLTTLIVISVMLCLVALGAILLLSAQDSQGFGGDKGLPFLPPDQQHAHAYGHHGENPHANVRQTRGIQPNPRQSFSDVGRTDSHASSAHSLVSAGRPPEPPLPGWPGAHGEAYGAYGAPAPMRNGGGSPAKHFCPELVVPRGHEAVLAVPLLDRSSFEVRDVEGKPVIRAESAPFELHRPVVVLHAAGPSGKRLAFCRMAGQGGGGQNSHGRTAVDIFNAHEERFGTISKVLNPTMLPAMWRSQDQPRPTAEPFRPCYIFSGSGVNLLLSGNFVDHAVSITGEQRELIADTEPSPMAFDQNGTYYRLRVASTGDVGLILSALLAIKVMEMR